MRLAGDAGLANGVTAECLRFHAARAGSLAYRELLKYHPAATCEAWSLQLQENPWKGMRHG
jgi:hypothetical protein